MGGTDWNLMIVHTKNEKSLLILIPVISNLYSVEHKRKYFEDYSIEWTEHKDICQNTFIYALQKK